jgi:oligoendopeptidase F
MPKKQEKLKMEWDLKKLFYSSPRDPKITKDIATAKRAILLFEKKYKNQKGYLKNETKLFQALEDYTRLYKKALNSKPLYYLDLLLSVESDNTTARALQNKLGQELTVYENKILFFTLHLGTISKKQQKIFLASKKLSKYHHFLKQIFAWAPYDLTEPEEQIKNLLSTPAYSMWKKGVSKVRSQQMVHFKGKDIPVQEGINILSTLPKTKRRKLWNDIMDLLSKNVGDFAEAEMNALLTYKKTMDDLRGFEHPYSSRILNNENTEKEVEALARVVTEHYPLSHRFYKLKKKLMKLPDFEYVDQLASIGTIKKKFTYADALARTRKAFEHFDPSFRSILDDFVSHGQIDVAPKKGKSGGAFCASMYGSPTCVLLNHTPTFRSVTTLAHEMGHAIHAEMSKKQLPMEYHAGIAVAEVASTLFENTVFDDLFETLTEKEKIIALHDKLNDSMTTIFRQIAFYTFEVELHGRFREEGYLSQETMAAMLTKHTQAYLGDAVHMQERDGNFFIYLSHIRTPFYVYAYTYGELISNALYTRYKENPAYIKEIKQFLGSGSSVKPVDMFKSIGIDTTNPSFFVEGLKRIEENITQLEKLVNNKI